MSLYDKKMTARDIQPFSHSGLQITWIWPDGHLIWHTRSNCVYEKLANQSGGAKAFSPCYAAQVTGVVFPAYQ